MKSAPFFGIIRARTKTIPNAKDAHSYDKPKYWNWKDPSVAMKKLQLGKLLRKSNITKSCGVPAYEVFQFLLLLVFQGKNLYRFLNSKHKDQAVSKNAYYRFLNETSYNWRKFLLLLAAKVTSSFAALTRKLKWKRNHTDLWKQMVDWMFFQSN